MVEIKNRVVRLVLVICVVFLLGTTQSLAQDLASIIKEAQTRYAKSEQEIKDMAIAEEMKMVTEQGEMTSQVKMFKKGNKFRMEMAMQVPEAEEIPQGMGGMQTIIIYDGKDTWMVSSFMGKKKLSPEEGKEYLTERNWWELVSEKGKIVGTEKVDKRECYVVEMEKGKESPFTKLWLDKKSLDLVKAESIGSEGETVLVVNSDFRKIKGDWEMAYKREIYVDGELMSTSLVKSVDINKGLSDDLFDPNKVKFQKKGSMMRKMMKEMILEEAQEEIEEEVEEKIDEGIENTIGR